jgi:hypothetical protein
MEPNECSFQEHEEHKPKNTQPLPNPELAF